MIDKRRLMSILSDFDNDQIDIMECKGLIIENMNNIKQPESNVVNPLLCDVPDDIADFMQKSTAYLVIMVDDKAILKDKLVEYGNRLMKKYKLDD